MEISLAPGFAGRFSACLLYLFCLYPYLFYFLILTFVMCISSFNLLFFFADAHSVRPISSFFFCVEIWNLNFHFTEKKKMPGGAITAVVCQRVFELAGGGSKKRYPTFDLFGRYVLGRISSRNKKLPPKKRP
ncbi:MAG: hypothetical protein IKH57_15120 [Clostridia bacterium]|nr:hypothetical protein [Clostridia bacterium]